MNYLEDIFSVTALLVVLAGVGLALSAVRLNIMVFLVLNLSVVLVGLIMLGSDIGISTAYGLGILGLIVGYSVASRYHAVHSSDLGVNSLKPPTSKALSDPVVYSVVFVAGCLGLYHLIVSGIPILSSSVEVKRFDFTSSGFFGIPGRMYLYGIPFAWMVASANAQANGIRWRSYVPWKLATTFLVATSLMSGFKSGLLATTYTMLIAYFIITGARISIGKFASRFWLAFSIPVIYGLSVATTYSTYDVAGQPLWMQLLRRITVVGAQPVQFAMSGQKSNLVDNGIWNDLVYFVAKYSGHEIPRMFSLERSISADIIGADPSSSAWTTPVTLGGFAELTYSFGPIFANFVMILIGVFLAYLHARASATTKVMAVRAILAFGVYNWLLKGGLIYYTLNIIAVVAILAVVGLSSHLVLPSRQSKLSPSFAGGLKFR